MISYDKFLSHAGDGLRESAIRRMGTVLGQARDIVSFAPGYPAEDQFPWSALTDISRELLTGADGSVLQYGPTRGFRPLRDAIVALMGERGITAALEQIVVTTGSQQGLDLVARVLLDPGDVALLELPSYTGAITAFRNVGATLVGVPQEADGIDLDELDRRTAALRDEGRRVKLLYLVPNFQNPTGLLLSPAKRQQVLQWASRRDVLVVEDDPYKDLYFPDRATSGETRPIAAADDDGRVIYLSSFSKTLAPGLRVAWLAAPEPLAAKLELAKQAEDLCTGALDQRIVYEACRRGLIASRLPKLREHYQHKRDVMAAALARHLSGRISWAEPRGGFFLWARLAEPWRSSTLLPVASAHGVIFVTGGAFFVDGTGDEYLRLSFSAPAPERIEEGVARLASAMGSGSISTETAALGTPGARLPRP
jgi:2-aminoadipate transaminase